MSTRAAAAVVAVGVLPWLVVLSGDSVGFVLSVGLLNPATGHLTTLPAYLFELTRGLPEPLLGWPVATLLWLAAVVSALVGRAVGREDRRLTGGLLVLAGLSLLPLAVAVGRPRGVSALPVGAVGLWAVAWWGYGDALRAVARGGTARER
ncbi:MAG: TIGR04206 family protein [Halobacteriales archaeon]|nr:TIGR04206 family protein [Halobacteriales archaeon]